MNPNQIILKDNFQIEAIRKSCKLAAQTLEFIKSHVQPGITTNRLDELMDEYITAHGATSACKGYGFSKTQPGFPKSTCISINEVVCHGIPSEYILKEGDIVSLDVTTILNGFFGDTAITLPVGEVSEDAKHLIEVSKKCLDLGIQQVKPGQMTGVIGAVIMPYAILQGCTVVDQFCGHGTGIFFHEGPQINHASKKHQGVLMHSGMIFTIEPMINLGAHQCKVDENDKWTVRTLDGSLSAQFEHTILVTNKGFEILTLA